MEKSTTTTRRAGSLARTACLACRRLKMKCVGAGSPPCVRCSKVGRYCVVPTTDQHHRTSPDSQAVQKRSELQRFSTAPALNVDSTRAVLSPVVATNAHNGTRPLPNHNSTQASSPRSTISRERWLSALPTVCRLPILPAYNSVMPGYGHWYGQTDIAELPEWSQNNRAPILDTAHTLPTDEELCHLSRFFVTNFMEHIPVLTDLDISDLITVVKSKRLLACSMAYVAARFVPGCRVIRTKLAPTIRAMVWLQFDQFESNDDQRWTLLQALAVLYTWAPLPSLEAQGNTEIELNLAQLRTSIEALALRYSLHSSAEELARLVKHGTSNLRQTFTFRKYTYWLWLFSLGYFHSLISQTPPTIREDAAINVAPQLLENLIHDVSVRQILAPVELCLLWIDAGVRCRGLGEWWCGISAHVELDSRLTVLVDFDKALHLWRQKWARPETSSRLEGTSQVGSNCSIDIYYYYTRFCICTYVAKLYQSSISAESHLSPIINLVTQSIDRASDLCSFLLKLTPLAKSSMGFSSEIIFAMVASCCWYLVHIYNSSTDLDLLQPSLITAIAEVAELMIDLGVDSRHSALVYGQSILVRLQPTRSGEVWQKSPSTSSHKNGQTWSMGTGPQQALSSPETGAGVDGSWPAQALLNSHVVPSPASHCLAITSMASSNGNDMWQNYRGAQVFQVEPF